MKLKTYSLALVASLAFLASCMNPAQNARLMKAGDVGLTYLAAKGRTDPADLTLARDLGGALIPALIAEPVDLTSSK